MTKFFVNISETTFLNSCQLDGHKEKILDSTFKTYQKLMPFKVTEILFVSSPYDAFIIEEDGVLMEDVLTSYKGIGLINPPRFTVVSTAEEALDIIQRRKFDLVVTMPKFFGMDAITLGKKIKEIDPHLTVVLLVHSLAALKHFKGNIPKDTIDKIFIWSGNRNIMLAIVKWTEDRSNVDHDTLHAMVRVLILVEDSPYYYSSLLPILYESVVKQTQNVLDDSLNEEHRLMKLRARTKILLAENFEEGMILYLKYKPYILGIFSDVRFHRNDQIDPQAGFTLIEKVRQENPNLPVLLLSKETMNREKAKTLGIHFQDKNSPSLHNEIKKFMVQNMGFGDFVFRTEKGVEMGRAVNLMEMEKKLTTIPLDSLMYHIKCGHFSNWLMARSEIVLASKFRDIASRELTPEEIREKVVSYIHEKRVLKKKGVIATFKAHNFEVDIEFMKMGDGSLGGKARGLAFMSKYVQRNMGKFKRYKNINLIIPQTIVLTTDCYDLFMAKNNLEDFAYINLPDHLVAERFLKADLPVKIKNDLRVYLDKIRVPLAVRSSSLLEDSKYQPYAGLYKTYMLPNNDADLEVRLEQLSKAIKLVYSSIYYEGPKAFSRTTLNRIEEERMAVIIQHLVGTSYGEYFYPCVSGTAQSHNFYPVQYMKPEEGIAQLAMGFGKIVVEGGNALRFSPKYPQFLPQFSSVDDMLSYSQKSFYALKMDEEYRDILTSTDDRNLYKREIFDAINEWPIVALSGSYHPQDHVVRDSYTYNTTPVLNFSRLLKMNLYQFPEFLSDLLKMTSEGLGCEVEIEFSMDIPKTTNDPLEFYLLQARPMITAEAHTKIEITDEDQKKAVIFSTNALGRGESNDILDIIYVRPENFNVRYVHDMVVHISKFNGMLEKEERKFLLVGPGRWGTSDPHLGIPVCWQHISSVAAIVEANIADFRPDPSQGTHFFQNLTSLGVAYFTIYDSNDFIQWKWFDKCNVVEQTQYVSHIRLDKPLLIKINGRKNHGVVIPSAG